MAILHVKTPNGTTKTVDLETMNITSSLQQNGWCKLPNGLIIQWLGRKTTTWTSEWSTVVLPLANPNEYRSAIAVSSWRYHTISVTTVGNDNWSKINVSSYDTRGSQSGTGDYLMYILVVGN